MASHWTQDVQMDVVAVNWRERAILLGECKWGVDAVGLSILRKPLDKTPHALQVLPEGEVAGRVITPCLRGQDSRKRHKQMPGPMK